MNKYMKNETPENLFKTSTFLGKVIAIRRITTNNQGRKGTCS